MVGGEDINLCTGDPGKNVDLYRASDLQTVIEVWQDDTKLKDALRDEQILATGAKQLMRSLPDLFTLCSFAGSKSML